MSTNIFKNIKFFITTKNINFQKYSIFLCIPHLIYTLSTTKEDNILITNKYKYVSNGFTNFMVVNDKNIHYNINNSCWFWKWNSIEDWHNLKIGQNINAQYYGLRIPFLGCFPNIINTNVPVRKNDVNGDKDYKNNNHCKNH
jgi:hypothetical protein